MRHADFSITFNIYADTLTGIKKASMEALDGIPSRKTDSVTMPVKGERAELLLRPLSSDSHTYVPLQYVRLNLNGLFKLCETPKHQRESFQHLLAKVHLGLDGHERVLCMRKQKARRVRRVSSRLLKHPSLKIVR